MNFSVGYVFKFLLMNFLNIFFFEMGSGYVAHVSQLILGSIDSPVFRVAGTTGTCHCAQQTFNFRIVLDLQKKFKESTEFLDTPQPISPLISLVQDRCYNK
jgi:hypothetical protein